MMQTDHRETMRQENGNAGKQMPEATGMPEQKAPEASGRTETPEAADRTEKRDGTDRRRRPARKKAEPGVRIGNVFFPYVFLRRLLIGVGAVLLALLLFFFARAFVRGGEAIEKTESTAEQAFPAEASAEPQETTLSAEELFAIEREKLEEEVLSGYENLGIVNTQSGGYINLRSEPDSVDMTNIIGKLANLAACDVISTEGEWSLVSSGGFQGYANNRYILTGEEAEALAREEIRQRAVVRTDRLNIRTAPEIDPENVVGKALRNERYVVTEINGDWAKIKADSIDAVEEAYINIADGNAEILDCLNGARKLDLREMVLTQFDNLVISNTGDYLNIRETPSDEGIDNICGKFPSRAGGELLETVEAEDGSTWYKIKSGKVTGYVSADYCATGNAARELAVDGAVLTAEIRTEALNVRSEPSTEASAWTQVVSGQEYHVLNQLDGWVEIELDSSDGEDESDKAYISTRDNNVEVRYGLPVAIEYYPAVEAANAAAAFRNEIVNYACQFVGNPYVWGGTSLTNGADCSGFTMKVLEHFGISIPRVSRDQAKAGVAVSSANMRPGDLVFYANKSGVVNHVGMYIGNGQVVNAASRRSGIRIYSWNYRTPVAIRNVIGD